MEINTDFVIEQHKSYEGLLSHMNKQEDLLWAISSIEVRFLRYKEQKESDLAEVSIAYKTRAVKNMEYALQGRSRLILRLHDQQDKFKKDAEERFIQRLHRIQANDPNRTPPTSKGAAG